MKTKMATGTHYTEVADFPIGLVNTRCRGVTMEVKGPIREEKASLGLSAGKIGRDRTQQSSRSRLARQSLAQSSMLGLTGPWRGWPFLQSVIGRLEEEDGRVRGGRHGSSRRRRRRRRGRDKGRECKHGWVGKGK
ncbi:uncharacterized protein J3R85_005373 [Psidium guajava]|nr:uncharacterized protein J3R85_005373 [Psidium guajava]